MNKPSRVVPQYVELTGEHAYYRPWGSEVSGFKDNTAKHHRSPCPALNGLANHGYLPRDGKSVTPALLQQALVQVYNLERALTAYSEAAVMLLVMGEHSTTSISVDRARVILVEERIPQDYKKSSVPVTFAQSLWLALQLKMLALLS
ncbi:hypothetical protein JG688_00006518 [Phytophthora aleatoria]|uniref:Heme haloperoxidase family profile domain-containing protein n=1 Tax=Phytophthora aleatoria TaxID=2496075 RepID=A0A8J5ITL7_9STRA|nr:hypothetical protein JG688_00006518 [Phytophthora aleatoria]